MWTSPTKKYTILFWIILLIGFLGGIFFLNGLSEANQEIILNNINNWVLNISNNHINYIIIHLSILFLLLLLAYFIVGLPLAIFYIFYHGFSLGFILATLGSIFGFKGYLFGLLYIIFTKSIYTLLLLFLFIFLFKISEYSFLKIIKKVSKNEDLNKRFYKKSFIIILIVFISDLIIYFIGNGFLNIFKFLLN